MVDAAARQERQIGELFDSRNDHEKRISRLEYWRTGNGAPGAESRLHAVESKMEHLDRDAVLESSCAASRSEFEQRILRALSQSRKTRPEVIKAWSPVLVGLIAALSPIILKLLE